MPRTRTPAFPELEKQILMNGIQKKDLAAMLGITPKSMSSKLTGRTEFTLSEIKLIAAAFHGISWETLFGSSTKELKFDPSKFGIEYIRCPKCGLGIMREEARSECLCCGFSEYGGQINE